MKQWIRSARVVSGVSGVALDGFADGLYGLYGVNRYGREKMHEKNA